MEENKIMRYYYYTQVLKENESSAALYGDLGDHNAEICRNCRGYCEHACPHKVEIRLLLNDAHRQLRKVT